MYEKRVTVQRFPILTSILAAGAFLGFAAVAASAEEPGFRANKEFDELTAAEKTAARAAGKKVFESKNFGALRVCGDPGNMPLSAMDGGGFQNKIMAVLAKSMGAEVINFWRPYLERGITRQTFETNDCDVLVDMPSAYGGVLTTVPVYRTTYVLAWRSDRGLDIKGLDDPKLRDLKIGVYQTSAIREVLKRRGLSTNVVVHTVSHNGDLLPEQQPTYQVQQVIDGKLDVAAVWGPFAGWFPKMKGEPLSVLPVNLMDDDVPLEFDLSLGVRPTNVVLKYALDYALEANRAEIEKILRDFGVPLVSCSKCVVPGDLPSHGSYTKPFEVSEGPKVEASPDQRVTRERLEAWLAEGADVQAELANAVLAADEERIRFLVEKGADINKPDAQGYGALQSAARNRSDKIIPLLVSLKADVNGRDKDGFTALIHAAQRNHVPSIRVLVANGADIEASVDGGFGPLSLAIEDGKLLAAKALIELGANVNAAAGTDRVTPIMVTASQLAVGEAAKEIERRQGLRSTDIATALIERGANVNAVNAQGVSALMIAAARGNIPMIGLLLEAGADPSLKSKAGKTAIDVARENLNEDAVKSITLFEATISERSQPRGGKEKL
ncbi:quinoprotein dehydrogenase-associated putative ABC transporter substrate-binding protein [Hyphomicrobium zavarzinii]|jgi:quinoprotein dehydrogenase-associated probable ABC transporter substrate-binding protein|uniref:quinoprotein dehydrogenase-associated putative ABC transporter substrate-binding protein n=1 Tax=Hyphomicrobium zavarzinii TaxID=48292 RepID=UPI000366D48F|nr:quinoprotein dehydrogenase-associated putative ABC transporter substrate-binding protein [Hyphomicrobium zavarzinii]